MNIDLTEREMQLLIDCIGTNIETVRRRHDPSDCMIAELLTELADLDMDLREALHRQDDFGLVAVDAKHDREGEVFMVAEDDFIQRGLDAREKAKANSRAAERRALKFVPPVSPKGTKGDKPAPKPKGRSKMQKHDVWEKPSNDPADW